MKVRGIFAGLGILTVAATLAACSGGGGGTDGPDGDTEGTPEGEITVLTQRTDLISDGTFDAYAKEFEEAYPGTSVKFEGITNYEQDVTTRLSSGNVGDVLALPTTVAPDQFSAFFEPLGETEELAKTYRFMTAKSYEGTAYGIPT